MLPAWEQPPFLTATRAAAALATVTLVVWGLRRACRRHAVDEKLVASPCGESCDAMWQNVLKSCKITAEQEPGLRAWLHRMILSAPSLEHALCHVLASKLATADLPANMWRDVLTGVLIRPAVHAAMEGSHPLSTLLRADLKAVVERDPACIDAAHALLSFKGFISLQAHRIAHVLWNENRKAIACAIQSRCSDSFAMDIHPAAQIGKGVFIDHGHGIVIGETAVVGDECSLLHGVTLGGTGKETGDRHPKLGNCVLVGSNASILGNVRIGDRAKIGAGSVVLSAIPSGATAVGLPAKVIGRSKEAKPALESDSALEQVFFRPGEADFRSIWRELDSRSEGFLTPLQFHQRLGRFGLSCAKVDELFFQMDKDNDGVVSEEEFAKSFHHFVRNVSSQNLAGKDVQESPVAPRQLVHDHSETSMAPDWSAVNASTWHAGVGVRVPGASSPSIHMHSALPRHFSNQHDDSLPRHRNHTHHRGTADHQSDFMIGDQSVDSPRTNPFAPRGKPFSAPGSSCAKEPTTMEAGSKPMDSPSTSRTRSMGAANGHLRVSSPSTLAPLQALFEDAAVVPSTTPTLAPRAQETAAT